LPARWKSAGSSRCSRDDRFLIVRGHDNPDIERVVYRHDRYWIVQKHADLVAQS
jgi:hypothetical protein